MQTIYSMCGYRHPVWAVSHAGHCEPPDTMDMIEGTNKSSLYIMSPALSSPQQTALMSASLQPLLQSIFQSPVPFSLHS